MVFDFFEKMTHQSSNSSELLGIFFQNKIPYLLGLKINLNGLLNKIRLGYRLFWTPHFPPYLWLPPILIRITNILNKILFNIIVLNHNMTCWKYENIHNTCYVYSLFLFIFFFKVNMMIFFKINQVQIFYVRYVYT